LAEVGVELVLEEFNSVTNDVVAIGEELEVVNELVVVKELVVVEEDGTVLVAVDEDFVPTVELVDEVELSVEVEDVMVVTALLDQENLARANITGPYPPHVAFTS
jgi:hypothetical protein